MHGVRKEAGVEVIVGVNGFVFAVRLKVRMRTGSSTVTNRRE